MDIRISINDSAEVRHLLLQVDTFRKDLSPRGRYRLEDILAIPPGGSELTACFIHLITTGRLPFEVSGIDCDGEQIYRYQPGKFASIAGTPIQLICEDN